jgi:hypothetical protein
VRRFGLVHGVWRVRWGAVLAAALVCSSAQTAASAPQQVPAHGRTAAAVGVIYGGSTSQQFPVVLEVSKNRRQIVSAVIGIRTICTSGSTVTGPDSYRRLSISRKGKFSASFGPETMRHDDGTTTDYEGSIRGTFNAARTKASGKWRFKGTDHDGTGAVTDTCDSGSVSWRVKQ